MIAALQASRNRLSVALNTTRKKTEMLEDTVAEKDDALVEAFDCLTRALSEYKNLQKLSQGAAAGVQFGVSQDDALRKLLILQERIEFMHEVCACVKPVKLLLLLPYRCNAVHACNRLQRS